MLRFILLIILYLNISFGAQKYTSKDVKCEVCKAVIQEMKDALNEVNPNKMLNVGGYRLDSDGNPISKSVPLIKSEIYLTELMERICDKMDLYVKTTLKKNGKFVLLKLLLNDQMNPLATEVNFVQDGDLNQSLLHFCLQILDDHAEVFIKEFRADTLNENLHNKICSEVGQYCDDRSAQEEDYFVKEEL